MSAIIIFTLLFIVFIICGVVSAINKPKKPTKPTPKKEIAKKQDDTREIKLLALEKLKELEQQAPEHLKADYTNQIKELEKELF